jgi:hypothetical protein
MACPALPYSSKLSHKWYNFREKVIEHKMCVSIFSTTFVWNIFHSKKNPATSYHNRKSVFMQSTRHSSQILIRPKFSQQIFRKNNVISNLMTVRPVGGELFHADGRTDMTKLIAALRNCANAPRNDPPSTVSFYSFHDKFTLYGANDKCSPRPPIFCVHASRSWVWNRDRPFERLVRSYTRQHKCT